MRKALILLTLSCLPILSQAQELARHKKPKATKDSNVFDLTKNQGTFIEYETPAEVKKATQKDAALKMTTPAETPAGGQLILRFSRLSIEAGNSKYFTVIVSNPQGQELFRKELDSRVPEPIHGTITYWKNVRIIPLPEPIPTGSTVHVVDAMSKKRHEYLIKF